MNALSENATQASIIASLNVLPRIDPEAEITARVDFLVQQLRGAGQKALVLGISGGLDSTVWGRLCQLVVEKCRDAGDEVWFYAVRLPYGQ